LFDSSLRHPPRGQKAVVAAAAAAAAAAVFKEIEVELEHNSNQHQQQQQQPTTATGNSNIGNTIKQYKDGGDVKNLCIRGAFNM
jgi:hypothetical protein